MDDESGPFIYVKGKYTPSTLDEMIQQYIEGHQHKYDHFSDMRSWLTHLIDLLIAERSAMRDSAKPTHHDLLAGDV